MPLLPPLLQTLASGGFCGWAHVWSSSLLWCVVPPPSSRSRFNRSKLGHPHGPAGSLAQPLGGASPAVPADAELGVCILLQLMLLLLLLMLL